MKRKLVSMLVCLTLGITCLASGCSSNTGEVEPSQSATPSTAPTSPAVSTPSATPSPTVTSGYIKFFHGRFSPEFGEFEARTDLPEGTAVLSQLYHWEGQVEIPEEWWPSTREFPVVNGHVVISVVYEKDGVPVTLSKSYSYHLKVWAKDHPGITGQYGFDFDEPPQRELEIKSYPETASYFLSGQVTNTTVSFTNVSSAPFKISPFPPEMSIRPRRSDKPGTAVRHFAAGSGELPLAAGETNRYDLTWDQKDDSGGTVLPGWYIIEVSATVIRETIPSNITYGSPVTLVLIEYPQGAMEKSIEINQPQTANGVTVTLRRIEMTKTGMAVDAFVNSVRDIVPTPVPETSPSFGASADYSAGGTAKYGGAANARPEGNGISLVWGGEGNPLDPVPSDAKELTFTITRINDVSGPWTFKIPLQ